MAGNGFGRIVVFSPHADDEVLGCFSFLSPACHVVYLGVEDREGTPRSDRLAEVARSAAKSGFRWQALSFRVNHFDLHELIAPLEDTVRRERPDTVLLPQPSYNQDHRAVHDAGITALRPHDRNPFVPNVLVFEQPDSVLWAHGRETAPNLFRPIAIDDKLHSYGLYASQVRGHRSPDLVAALARLRGSQSGCAFAEGFAVRRLVVAA